MAARIMWYVYVCTRIVQSIASILGNLLTIICVIKYRFLQTPANAIVASLALSDFLHGVVTGIIQPIRNLVYSWDIIKGFCMVGINLEVITVYAQFTSFSLLAIERCHSLLVQLNRRQKLGMTKVLLMVTFGWLVTMMFNIAMAVVNYPSVPEGTPCSVFTFFPPVYTTISFIFFLITTSVILICYSSVAWIAYKTSNQVVPAEPFNLHQTLRRRNDIKITRMMALVVGLFFIFYCPFFTTALLISQSSSPPPTSLTVVFYITITFYDVNFWINPLIYAWRNQHFRKAFKHLLSQCRFCRRIWVAMAGQPNPLHAQVEIHNIDPAPGNPIGPLVPRRDVIFMASDL